MSYAVRRLFVLSALTTTAVIASSATAIAVSVPGAPTNVSATAAVGKATIHWSPPSSDGGATIDKYLISISGGGVNQSNPLNAVNGATDYFFSFSGLMDHTSYTLSVKAHNSAGYGSAVSKSVTTPYRTTIALTAQSPIDYGHSSTLHATLSNADTKAAISGASVQLARRDHGTTTWIQVTSTTTNSSGVASFVVSPTRNEDYRVSFARAGDLGGSSAATTVLVRYVVTEQIATTTPAHGTSDRLTGTVTPSAAGQSVIVQQFFSNAWHDLQPAAPLSSTSTYSVDFVAPSAGTYTLRVLKPGTSTNATGTSPTFVVTAH